MLSLEEIYLPYCISRTSNINSINLTKTDVIFLFRGKPIDDIKSLTFGSCAIYKTCKRRNTSESYMFPLVITFILNK